MFANVKNIITISQISMDVMPTMSHLVVNAGLICDTQTSCLTHY